MIGFACKYISDDNTFKTDLLNTKTTTIKHLKTLSPDKQVEKLTTIYKHNINSISLMCDYVATLDPNLRMFRISSDILPFYSHEDFSFFWQDPTIQLDLANLFSAIRLKLNQYSIKVSFHPGQYVCLASDRSEVVDKSLKEFEYHVDMARFLGFGESFQDGCKINIHIGGRQGPKGIKAAYQRLSPEGKNLITVENDELSWAIEDCLQLADLMPTVIDLHHHWCKTNEYILPTDDRIKQTIESWRGIKPTLHYSLPREIMSNKKIDLNNYQISKQKLRAHSDFLDNQEANEWCLSFTNFDIMCEAKMKNLASKKLWEDYLK